MERKLIGYGFTVVSLLNCTMSSEVNAKGNNINQISQMKCKNVKVPFANFVM